MTVVDRINQELALLRLLPLNAEQIQCLHDLARLEEAADMLSDLRDRCRVRLPLPSGTPAGGPFDNEDDARDSASSVRADFPVIAVDRMATDESRSTGEGDEYYVTGYAGADAALALAERDSWVAVWVRGVERSLEV